MDRGTAIIVGLCAFLGLWYGIGHLYNRRRGQRLFRWIETGLAVLGSERQAGWIGSPASGARINILHANRPFRRLEITLLLARREVPLLLLIDHLRGKRDGLIIKGTLRSPQRGEIEVGPVKSRVLYPSTDTPTLRQESSWTLETGPHRLTVAHRGPGTQQQLAQLWPWLEVYGAHLYRFSWQKHDPHIQLQMNASALLATPSEAFLADLQVALGKP